jgi:hypothetical protein
VTAKNPPIGVVGITPRRGKNISQELDSCNILLKTSGIETLHLEPLLGGGFGRIYVEGSQLRRALQILLDQNIDAAVWPPP